MVYYKNVCPSIRLSLAMPLIVRMPSTVVWIPLLYDTLMLLVSSWYVFIGFCNHLLNLTFLSAKKLWAVIFAIFFSLFSSHTVSWACSLWSTYSVCMFSLYLSHSLLDSNETCASVFLMHALQVQEAKATTQTYLRRHFTQQSKRFYNWWLNCHFLFKF